MLAEELKKQKEKCEKIILEAIIEFEKETGLHVSIIDYNEDETFGMITRSITLDVKI